MVHAITDGAEVAGYKINLGSAMKLADASPEALVDRAVRLAEVAMDSHGEMPIAAVVEMGGWVIGSAFTQDRRQDRRLIHADLLAMDEADRFLRHNPRPAPVRLAVNLEPCVMCLGAAMALRVDEIYFGLESPADGASGVAAGWQRSPDLPWYGPPRMVGGLHREAVRDQFRRFCESAPDSGYRRWARTLADLPGGAG